VRKRGGVNSSMSESKGVQGFWLILTILLFTAVMLWGYLDQNHYFYHVKTARITSSTWGNHEVKQCATWNRKGDPPVLECDDGHSEIQQTVPVRFYGDTRSELDPETLRFRWSCEKREESSTPIRCRLAP
jgi:hypothetical protein